VKSPRFVIEGTWNGYRSSQRRIVHRTVHKGSEKKLRAWVAANRFINYTDGTSLVLDVRDCKPREKVQVLNGYGKLIRDCCFYNVSSVAALNVADGSWPKPDLQLNGTPIYFDKKEAT
jgi:hypothetical protein